MSGNDESTASRSKAYYRQDGVRIGFDPYAPGMAETYGAPGETDIDGFDPYNDTVGPGIYGGCVKRDKNGAILYGAQYQGHNPRPGPVYAGTGYSRMSVAIQAGPDAVEALLAQDPSLAHDISTGGATPLHLCGMSTRGQASVRCLLKAGAKADALDTYGYTPMHRMASNDLADGATVLVDVANVDPTVVPVVENTSDVSGKDGTILRTMPCRESPMQVAIEANAIRFIEAMRKLGFHASLRH